MDAVNEALGAGGVLLANLSEDALSPGEGSAEETFWAGEGPADAASGAADVPAEGGIEPGAPDEAGGQTVAQDAAEQATVEAESAASVDGAERRDNDAASPPAAEDASIAEQATLSSVPLRRHRKLPRSGVEDVAVPLYTPDGRGADAADVLADSDVWPEAEGDPTRAVGAPTQAGPRVAMEQDPE